MKTERGRRSSASPPDDDWRGLLPLALVGLLVLGTADTMLGVAWPSVRAAFGQPLAALGEVAVAQTAGFLIASSISGSANARLGRGTVLALAAAAGTLALAGYALAPAWPVFVLSGVAYGLWSGSIDPGINSWMALIGDVRAMNLIHFAYGLGATVGPLLVTGALTFGPGWRAAYGAAIASVGALLPAFALTRRRWGRPSDVATGGDPRAGRRRLPWLLLAVTLATFFVYVGVEVGAGAWTFSHLVGMGSPQAMAGLTVSIYWAALTAGRLLLAGIAGRQSPLSLTLAGCGLALIGAGLYVTLPVGVGALVALVLLGLGLAGIFPLLIALTPARFGEPRTPHVIGCIMASSNVSSALVPAGMGVGMQALGVEALPVFVLGGCCLLLALNLVAALLAPAAA